MKFTFLSEFLSRGMGWARLLIIPLIIGDESYAFIILLVTAEALIGDIIAFPQKRQILIAKELCGGPLWSGILLWGLTSPLQYIVSYLYFGSHLTASLVVISTLFFSVSQSLIYMLRVIGVGVHNRGKILAYSLSTIIFFVLVPLRPEFYPVSSFIMMTVLLVCVRRRGGEEVFKRGSLGFHRLVSGWGNFGLQALSVSIWQYGNRFIAGYFFSAAVLSGFMRGYLLTSGIIFIYSAVMIVYERGISIALETNHLSRRLIQSSKVLGVMVAFWIVYAVAIGILIHTHGGNVLLLRKTLWGVEPFVTFIFLAVFLVRAVQLAYSPVVTAMGDKSVVTIAALVSLAAQIIGYAWFWDKMTPVVVALTMLVSLLLSVAVLLTRILQRIHVGRQTHGMEMVE